MRVLTFLICAAVCAFSLHAADSDDDDSPPVLNVPLLKGEAPKIDGLLDDAAWKDAAVGGEFRLKEGSKARSKTRLSVTRDDKTLFIAVQCFEEPANIKKLHAGAKDHDQDNIWNDDSIELFIDPTNKRVSYYQFIINAKGVVWDAFNTEPGKADKSWNPDVKIAAKAGVDSWNCEIAIPFAAFDRTDTMDSDWGFNVSRNRTAIGEGTFWSPVYSDVSHRPERFGKLTGMPKK